MCEISSRQLRAIAGLQGVYAGSRGILARGMSDGMSGINEKKREWHQRPDARPLQADGV